MYKRKLTIDEQISHMESKGITFNNVSKTEAKRFLTNNTYYFKLKAYERNYDTYKSTSKKGQFLHLDFAYLLELSTLDMHLRRLILGMSLDIEHALKVQLLLDLSQNTEEDGYSIVQEYLNVDYNRIRAIQNKIGKSAVSDLIKTHGDDNNQYALWEIVEILSFGEFIDIYMLYYSKYHSNKDFSSYLWSIKFLRNAAAHNNCLLNSITKPYDVTIHKNKEILNEISKIKAISENSRKKWMKNPVIHDFVILVYVYLNAVKSSGIKQHGIDDLHHLFNERMPKNPAYFEKNLSIVECYRFTQKIVNTFCNKYRK